MHTIPHGGGSRHRGDADRVSAAPPVRTDDPAARLYRFAQRRFGPSPWIFVHGAAIDDADLVRQGYQLGSTGRDASGLTEVEWGALRRLASYSVAERDELELTVAYEALLARCPFRRWVPPIDLDVRRGVDGDEATVAIATSLDMARRLDEALGERGLGRASWSATNDRGGMHGDMLAPWSYTSPQFLAVYGRAVRAVARSLSIPLLTDCSRSRAERPLVVLDDTLFQRRVDKQGQMYRLIGSIKPDGGRKRPIDLASGREVDVAHAAPVEARADVLAQIEAVLGDEGRRVVGRPAVLRDRQPRSMPRGQAATAALALTAADRAFVGASPLLSALWADTSTTDRSMRLWTVLVVGASLGADDLRLARLAWALPGPSKVRDDARSDDYVAASIESARGALPSSWQIRGAARGEQRDDAEAGEVERLVEPVARALSVAGDGQARDEAGALCAASAVGRYLGAVARVHPERVYDIACRVAARSGHTTASAWPKRIAVAACVALSDAQRPYASWPRTLGRHLTAAQVADVAQLGRLLGPRIVVDVAPPSVEPPSLDARRVATGAHGPPASLDDMRTFARDVLGCGLDRAGVLHPPPGEGKTEALVRMIALDLAPEVMPRIQWAVDNHDLADEILVRVHALAAAHGRVVSIAKQPRFECEEGRGAEYQLAAAEGYNPVEAVCWTCPRWSAKADSTCAYHAERALAAKARVLLAQKRSLAVPGYWASAARADVDCVVVEEDVVPTVAPTRVVTRGDLEQFVRAVARVRRHAAMSRRVRGMSSSGLLVRGEGDPALERACELIEEAARELIGVLSYPWRVGTIAAPSSLARLALGLSPLLTLRKRLHELAGGRRAPGSASVPPPNLLPLIERLARTGAIVAVRDLHGEEVRGQEPALHVLDAQAIPARVRVLVLDATADLSLVSAALGRTVRALGGGASRRAIVLQVPTRDYSRRRLRTPEGREGAVSVVRALAQRHVEARRIGLVTHKVAIDEIVESVDDERVQGLHFAKLRGRDALKGVDVLIVLGTYRVPEVEILARALLLGATHEELTHDTVEHVHVEVAPGVHARRLVHSSPIMQRAYESLVHAELWQAIGRGPRGDAQGVIVYVLSPERVDVPYEHVILGAAELALGDVSPELFRAAEAAAADGTPVRTFARAQGVSRRLAAQVIAAARVTAEIRARSATARTAEDEHGGAEDVRGGGGDGTPDMAQDAGRGPAGVLAGGGAFDGTLSIATAAVTAARASGYMWPGPLGRILRRTGPYVPTSQSLLRHELCGLASRYAAAGLGRRSTARALALAEATWAAKVGGRRPVRAWEAALAAVHGHGLVRGRVHHYVVHRRAEPALLVADVECAGVVTTRWVYSLHTGYDAGAWFGGDRGGRLAARIDAASVVGIARVRRPVPADLRRVRGAAELTPSQAEELTLPPGRRPLDGLPRAARAAIRRLQREIAARPGEPVELPAELRACAIVADDHGG